MARDLSVEVRQFTVAAMSAAAPIIAIAGSRVYGPAQPRDTPWPFVRTDLPTATPESDGCGGGSRYGFNVHAFAKGDDERAVGQLAAAVAAALDEREGAIAGTAYVRDMLWTRTQLFRDVDEVNGWHGVISFTTLVSG